MHCLVVTIASAALLAGSAASQHDAVGGRYSRRIDYRPRTLDAKVADAELIVLGTATAFGDRHPPVAAQSTTSQPADLFIKLEARDLYERNLQVSVADVLWPPSFTNRSDIVFRYEILESWPRSWWDYTNTPGVFFLTKNTTPERGEWVKLHRYDDWIESQTNMSAVLRAIERQKGTPIPATLQGAPIPSPKTTRYDSDPKARSAYLAAFRKGYLAALVRKHGLLMQQPWTAEEKAGVVGYADGQLAGDEAWSEWNRKWSVLTR